MANKLNSVAAVAATNYAGLSGNKQAALDPATILSFVDLIMKVIEMFKGCGQKPATAADTAKNPGLFARLRLRGLVRESMSRADFRDHGQHIINSLHKTGSSLNVDDITQLYNEVH